MTDEPTITEAIDLAERLLDEVTRAEHDWEAVEHLADALAKLAATATATAAAAAADTTATDRARRRSTS
jgi:hypothetical protein